MSNDTSNWANSDLHKALVVALPAFVKEPFSDTPRIDVRRLHNAIGKSPETIYKWLRANRLTPRNAEKLIAIAESDANIAALKSLRRAKPTIKDFTRFFFA